MQEEATAVAVVAVMKAKVAVTPAARDGDEPHEAGSSNEKSQHDPVSFRGEGASPRSIRGEGHAAST
jgi:hypothetical protein